MRSELPVSTRTARRGDKLPEPGKLPELRLNYGPVEKALAAIYAATEDDIRRKAFRARINFFQRAKVLGNEAGKGQRNAYSIVQIGRWLACLELTELGLSPTTAGELDRRPLGCVRTDLPGRAGVRSARSGPGRHRLVHWRRPPHERKLGTEIRIPRCPEHSGMHATQVAGSRDGMDVDDGQ
jgi:hypothetical protein